MYPTADGTLPPLHSSESINAISRVCLCLTKAKDLKLKDHIAALNSFFNYKSDFNATSSVLFCPEMDASSFDLLELAYEEGHGVRVTTALRPIKFLLTIKHPLALIPLYSLDIPINSPITQPPHKGKNVVAN